MCDNAIDDLMGLLDRMCPPVAQFHDLAIETLETIVSLLGCLDDGCQCSCCASNVANFSVLSKTCRAAALPFQFHKVKCNTFRGVINLFNLSRSNHARYIRSISITCDNLHFGLLHPQIGQVYANLLPFNYDKVKEHARTWQEITMETCAFLAISIDMMAGGILSQVNSPTYQKIESIPPKLWMLYYRFALKTLVPHTPYLRTIHLEKNDLVTHLEQASILSDIHLQNPLETLSLQSLVHLTPSKLPLKSLQCLKLNFPPEIAQTRKLLANLSDLLLAVKGTLVSLELTHPWRRISQLQSIVKSAKPGKNIWPALKTLKMRIVVASLEEDTIESVSDVVLLISYTMECPQLESLHVNHNDLLASVNPGKHLQHLRSDGYDTQQDAIDLAKTYTTLRSMDLLITSTQEPNFYRKLFRDLPQIKKLKLRFQFVERTFNSRILVKAMMNHKRKYLHQTLEHISLWDEDELSPIPWTWDYLVLVTLFPMLKTWNDTKVWDGKINEDDSDTDYTDGDSADEEEDDL